LSYSAIADLNSKTKNADHETSFRVFQKTWIQQKTAAVFCYDDFVLVDL